MADLSPGRRNKALPPAVPRWVLGLGAIAIVLAAIFLASHLGGDMHMTHGM